MSSNLDLKPKLIGKSLALSDEDEIASSSFIKERTSDIPLLILAFEIFQKLRDPSFLNLIRIADS